MGKEMYHFLYILGEVFLFYYLFWICLRSCYQHKKYVPGAQRCASFTIDTSPPPISISPALLLCKRCPHTLQGELLK